MRKRTTTFGLVLAVTVALAACGSGRQASTQFAWLQPAAPPSGWKLVGLPSGAILAYPPSWQQAHADPGSASAAVIDAGLITRYLNATPRQGGETLADWARFRPGHNADEGDKNVQVLAAADGLRFRGGTGSCVIDRYQTTRTSYEEIACLVRGARAQTVVVAAALASDWASSSPELERAISAFQT